MLLGQSRTYSNSWYISNRISSVWPFWCWIHAETIVSCQHRRLHQMMLARCIKEKRRKNLRVWGRRTEGHAVPELIALLLGGNAAVCTQTRAWTPMSFISSFLWYCSSRVLVSRSSRQNNAPQFAETCCCYSFAVGTGCGSCLGKGRRAWNYGRLRKGPRGGSEVVSLHPTHAWLLCVGPVAK